MFHIKLEVIKYCKKHLNNKNDNYNDKELYEDLASLKQIHLVMVQTEEGKNMRVDVSINNYTLLTDLSITHEEIIKGLSSKSSLKENEGMLFVLNSSSRRGFWMKDMKFAIDVIWLNENKEIIDIKKALILVFLIVLSIILTESQNMYWKL